VVVALATAVRERKSVRLHYRSGLGEETERKLDPYAVVNREGYWYAVGQDHLRGEAWLFRLDRVLEAEALGEAFVHPPGFDVLRHCSTL
jgi:predicted DNA-binding transcriptional regulator YafY